MDNLFFFIQARANSSRLPGKMLLPFFEGKTILQVIVERLLNNFPSNKVCVLTSDSEQDDILIESVSHYSVDSFRGNEYNVLDRFISAGNYFGAEHVIRICADNPFLSIDYLSKLLNTDMGKEDYLSFSVLGKPVIKCHYGLFAERTKISSLKRIIEHTSDRFYYEHVTNYLYEHPDVFRCRFLEISSEIKHLDGIRLTVDTLSDFKNAQFLFRKLNNTFSFSAEDIGKIVEDYPELKLLMAKEIKLNTK